jgi:hypothetical protein
MVKYEKQPREIKLTSFIESGYTLIFTKQIVDLLVVLIIFGIKLIELQHIIDYFSSCNFCCCKMHP